MRRSVPCRCIGFGQPSGDRRRAEVHALRTLHTGVPGPCALIGASGGLMTRIGILGGSMHGIVGGHRILDILPDADFHLNP